MAAYKLRVGVMSRLQYNKQPSRKQRQDRYFAAYVYSTTTPKEITTSKRVLEQNRSSLRVIRSNNEYRERKGSLGRRASLY